MPPPFTPFHLTDEQWALVQPLLQPPAAPARGRPPLDERLILDAILWKFANLAPWYGLPPAYPSHQTCYRRYCKWKRTGAFRQVMRLLYQHLTHRGGFDLQAALQSGAARLRQDGRRYTLTLPPDLPDDWRRPTARLFVGWGLRALRRAHTLRRRSRPRTLGAGQAPHNHPPG